MTDNHGGAPNRGCPLCHDMDDDEVKITTHIRLNCPVAIAMRESMGLPERGFNGHVTLNNSNLSNQPEPGELLRDESGQFRPRSEAGGDD